MGKNLYIEAPVVVVIENNPFFLFLPKEWASEEEDPSDSNVWEDNWDDDNVEDDFSKQLRFAL